MKNFILALAVCVSGITFASGKLTLENQYFIENKVIGPKLGVAIYEPFLGLAYNGWTGGGLNMDKEWWFSSKHDIDIPVVDDLTLSVGAAYRLNPKNESDVHVSLSYALWN